MSFVVVSPGGDRPPKRGVDRAETPAEVGWMMMPSLVGLAQALLSSVLAAAVSAAPLDWSRDGEWIAHLDVETSDAPTLPRGWFLSPDDSPQAPLTTTDEDSAATSRTYRVWATRASDSRGALIEESPHPLSSPAWGADGRSILFTRFVSSPSDAYAERRGQLELVIQSARDQQRVIVLQSDLKWEAGAVSMLATQRPAVSPDGRRVAVPRPSASGGAWVVLVDEDRVVQVIEGAKFPSWSPDGLRLAFLRLLTDAAADPQANADGEPVVFVHVTNSEGRNERLLTADSSLSAAPPVWSLDGQSLLMVSSPTDGPLRHTQVDLLRMNLDTGASSRIYTIESAAPLNGPLRFRDVRQPKPHAPVSIIRVQLAMDSEQEQAVGLVETDDGEQVVKWYHVQSQSVFKRIHPMDSGLRLASPSLSPNGRTVAFRVDDGTEVGLAAFCDLDTEEVTLLAPTDGVRLRWLDRLAATAIQLIRTWLPAPGVRATVVPILDELGGLHPRQYRLQRLAKFAGALLDDHAMDAKEGERLDEYRLFFAYLNRDYTTAEHYLDVVEARTNDPDARLRWLCLRAQILLGQNHIKRARGIIEYLTAATRPRNLVIEDSPVGPVVANLASPRSLWAEHLQQRASDAALQRIGQGALNDLEPGEMDLDVRMNGAAGDGFLNFPFAPPDGLGDGLEAPLFRPHQGLIQPFDPGGAGLPGRVPNAPLPGPGVPGFDHPPRPFDFEPMFDLAPIVELEVED